MSSKGLRYWCLKACTLADYFCVLCATVHTSGKSTQKALIFMPYRKAPKFSLKRPKLSFSNWRCIKFASRSAMLSLSSAKAGSRLVNGNSALDVDAPPLGVVCEARRLVRDGGRRGVCGRLGGRLLDCESVRLWAPEGGCDAGVVLVAIVACMLYARFRSFQLFQDLH